MRSKHAAAFLKRLTDWTHWPFLLFYAPLTLAWVQYYLRSRSLWFFTSANPILAFGGFEGESKSEQYRQLPAHLLPRSLFIPPTMPFAEVLQQVRRCGLAYPFIVKPDVGMKGILFRKIETEEQLQIYHRHMPADYIIQEFLAQALEVSVFYYRKPGLENGRITALISKELLALTGNGTATVAALVRQHPDGQRLLPTLQKKYGEKLEQVLPAGETFFASHIANLYNGARFKNLAHDIDANLTAVFDAISRKARFYYGRYDIKCRCVDDLKRGTGFYILEFNGAGSVPNHVFTGSYTLLQAYKEILRHWRLLYEASTINHKMGYRRWSFRKGYNFLRASKQHFKALKKLDAELVV